MPKAAAGEVIELDLGNQHGLQRMPLANPMTELSSDLAWHPSGKNA